MAARRKSISVLALCLGLTIITPQAPMVEAGQGLVQAAQKYIGLQERRNRAALKRILGVDPVRIPWCGAFMGKIVRGNGGKPPKGFLKASNWSRWGARASGPVAGSVAVMRSHVLVVTHVDGRRVCGISGNASNAVARKCYPRSRVIAYRRAG
jgi:uncharacterized protein (TIGR02594 family)